VAGEKFRRGGVRERFVAFLKNEKPRVFRRGSKFVIASRRKIRKASSAELSLVYCAFSLDDECENFALARCAFAASVTVERDQRLDEIRAEALRDQHERRAVRPARQHARDKTGGRKKCVAFLDDVAGGSERMIHECGVISCPKGREQTLPSR